MYFSWWNEIDMSAKSEVVMLGIVFLAFFGSIAFMAVKSFVERLKSTRPIAIPVNLPTMRMPQQQKEQGRYARMFFSFWKWYFRVLGI